MDPVTLPNGPPEHPILDYQALVDAGVAQLERLAGSRWTNFNPSDPGITLLEAGCYALTDLGYRIFHPVPDLLADGGAAPATGLFTAAQILTGQAVTLDDLRRVALDVDGVKNAWIEPVTDPVTRLRYDSGPHTISIDSGGQSTPTSTPVALRGLMRVFIEAMEGFQGSSLRADVARRLHAHRNLGEDFEDIILLSTQPVEVEAGIEIAATADPNDVLLEILRRVGAYMSPSIDFLTLNEALAAGTSIDSLFEGPALERGFITAAALAGAPRRTALYASDVMREIMNVPGVRAVRVLRLSGEEWSLRVFPGGAPRLDEPNSLIRLYKVGIEVTPNRASVASAYHAELVGGWPALARDRRDLMVPDGKDRAVSVYRPIEYDLPKVFGVGTGVLASSASPERQMQANQLRAYLNLFDALLANQFEQLAHVRKLLSVDDDSPSSYVSRLVGTDDGDGRPPILSPDLDGTALQMLVEDPASPEAAKRRNRFLNHLLARFGETFLDEAQPSASAAGAPVEAGDRMLRAKRKFLKNLPHLSGGRGTGYDYLSTGPGGDSAPALAERVRLKLGLPDDHPESRVLVIEHILLRAIPEDAVNALPFLEAARRADPFSAQITFAFPSALGATPDLKALIELVVRDETPAHLVAYIAWAEPALMDSLAAAYGAWLAALRDYWLTDRLGLPADADAAPPDAPAALQ